MRGEKLANLVLTGGALLGALGLLHVVYHYDVARTRQFGSAGGLVLFHLVPAGIALGLLLARRLPARYKLNLVLLLLSTGISLVAVDAFISTLPSPARDAAAARSAAASRAGGTYDPRSKLEVLMALRRQGIPAYPTVTSRVWLEPQADGSLKSRLTLERREVLPLAGGLSGHPSVFCNETGEWVSYRSDERGFHNPPGIWDRGRVDIAVLGDSFAEGWCVPSDRNFVGLIRQRVPSTLNLAVGANGPLLELAALREYLPALTPGLVLWFFFEGNDLCELRIERHSPLLMRYLDPRFTQDLPGKQAPLDAAVAQHLDAAIARLQRAESAPPSAATPGRRQARQYLERLTGILVLRHMRQRLGLTAAPAAVAAEPVPFARLYGCIEREGAHYLPVFDGEDAALFREILRQAQAAVAGWGGRLHFVYLPEWQRYRDPGRANPHRDQVLELVRTVGVPILDVHDAFRAHGDPLALFPFRQQGHYNAEGHRVVAETVLRAFGPRGE